MKCVKAGSDIHICASSFNLCGTNNQASRSIFSYLPGQVKGNSFLISKVRRVLNVVCFLLGNSLACEFYVPTFRNTLSVPSS